MTFLSSKRHKSAKGFQAIQESVLRLHAGSVPFLAVDLIVGNEIHLGAQLLG